MDTPVARLEPDADLERIRSIVKRHPFPPMVTAFDIRFGEYNENPAVWIAFKTTGEPERNEPAMRARGKILHDLVVAVRDDLLREVLDWYPFFRFEPADAPGGH